MKTYSQFELPYATSNTALAFALYIAGIPFADERQPLTNNYNADILKGLGYPQGSDIEIAVADAVTKRKAGRLDYGFKFGGRIEEATKGFDEGGRAVEGSERSAKAIVGFILEEAAAGRLSPVSAIAGAVAVVVKRWRQEMKEWSGNSDYRDTVQKMATGELRDADAQSTCLGLFFGGNFYAFAAAVMESRQQFMMLAFRNPAWIHIRHRGNASKLSGGRVKMPGFVTFSVNAESETRKHLGVPRK